MPLRIKISFSLIFCRFIRVIFVNIAKYSFSDNNIIIVVFSC
jgi:hypothetical protein